jgi:hypothetical protein
LGNLGSHVYKFLSVKLGHLPIQQNPLARCTRYRRRIFTTFGRTDLIAKILRGGERADLFGGLSRMNSYPNPSASSPKFFLRQKDSEI